jgi:hypothetical protein
MKLNRPNWFSRLTDFAVENPFSVFLLLNVVYALGYFVYAFVSWIIN